MPNILNPIEGVRYADPALAKRYFGQGAWIDMTLGEALRETARRTPQKLAYASDERDLAFRELDETTDRLAAALLELGLRPGDRAMFQMGTTVETIVALLGCYKAGIVPVCAVPQYREVEIDQLSAQTTPRAYFVQADVGRFDLVAFAGRMAAAHPCIEFIVAARGQEGCAALRMESLIDGMPLPQARERLSQLQLGSEDVLSFQLSGGSTGIPKIIPRFHAEYLGHCAAWMRQLGISPESKLIWSLPLLHNAGQIFALVSTMLLGVTIVLMPRVDVRRMLELIEAHRVTHALSIGPIAPQLVAYEGVGEHDLSSLQLFLTMSRADALEARIGVHCANQFGITEGLVLGNSCDAPALARHETQGASGCPLDEIRLYEPGSEYEVPPGAMGELCFRGPSTLRGYFNAPSVNSEAFTRDGFFRTGDMMSAQLIEGRTCYRFEGRLRDNVNRGGEKIGCEEVEAHVSQHPAVSDARLVAMPDPFYGEKGCIFIVPRPGHGAPGVGELGDFLVGRGLAKFKCPERVEIVDTFPLTRVGKVDKQALREVVVGRLKGEQAAGV